MPYSLPSSHSPDAAPLPPPSATPPYTLHPIMSPGYDKTPNSNPNPLGSQSLNTASRFGPPKPELCSNACTRILSPHECPDSGLDFTSAFLSSESSPMTLAGRISRPYPKPNPTPKPHPFTADLAVSSWSINHNFFNPHPNFLTLPQPSRQYHPFLILVLVNELQMSKRNPNPNPRSFPRSFMLRNLLS